MRTKISWRALFITCLLITLALKPTSASLPERDSLENLLRSLRSWNTQQPDTLRVRLLNEISREYLRAGDQQKALDLAENAQRLAEEALSLSNNLKSDTSFKK